MKKTVRRLSTVLMIMLILSICFTLVNFASVDAEAEIGVTTPTDAENMPDEPTIEPEGAWSAFLGAIETIVGEDFIKIASIVIEVVLFVFLVVLKKTNKTSLGDIVDAVSARNSKGERVSLTKVVAALHELSLDNADEMAAFKKEISAKLKDLTEAYGVQTVTHEQVKELAEATKALLQIFHSVYSNSKTIGVNVKDEEGRIYNEAMKRILALESEDSANVGKN